MTDSEKRLDGAEPSAESAKPDDMERLYAELEEKALHYNPNLNRARMRAAYEYAREKHGSQLRKDGSPYISHPLAAAGICAGMGLDEDSIIALLRHGPGIHPNACEVDPMKLTAFLFMLATMLAALLLVIRTFDGNPERLEPAVDAEGLEQPLRRFHQPSRLTKKDLPPLLGLTVLCAVLAFLNLGDRAAVTSWHTFAEAREAAVLTLPEETEVDRLQYFAGPTVGTWRVEWTADGQTWLGRERVEQTYVDVLKWMEFRPPEGFGRLKAVRITALSDDLILGEAALRDADGNLIPFRTEAAALADEQELVPPEESWRRPCGPRPGGKPASRSWTG